jgi:hypothetical protein
MNGTVAPRFLDIEAISSLSVETIKWSRCIEAEAASIVWAISGLSPRLAIFFFIIVDRNIPLFDFKRS